MNSILLYCYFTKLIFSLFFFSLNPLDVESETFVMYAQRRFPVQHQKKHLSKKQVSVDSLIMYTQKKLSNALHSFELKETQKAAIELFEKINQCISDSKKGDDEDSLIQNLIDFLMKKPELGNEAYCQLFKQMSGNPKRFVYFFISITKIIIFIVFVLF